MQGNYRTEVSTNGIEYGTELDEQLKTRMTCIEERIQNLELAEQAGDPGSGAAENRDVIFDSRKNIVDLDELHRSKDTILQKLDNPANWQSFVRMLKYMSWKIEFYNNYFVLIIQLKVVDTITY